MSLYNTFSTDIEGAWRQQYLFTTCSLPVQLEQVGGELNILLKACTVTTNCGYVVCGNVLYLYTQTLFRFIHNV